jgi:hypothetical protein
MVQVAPVQTFYNEIARISEVFNHFQGFFVDILSGKVLCDTAVVCIGEFGAVDLLVEKVIHVHVVDVPLYTFEVDIVFIPLSLSSLNGSLPIVFFAVFLFLLV